MDDVNVGASTVEWNAVSDGIECLGEGPWAHFSALPLGEHLVPTVALELRLVTELFRSRPDRYRPLIKYMRIRPCDIALLLRGMDERKIPKEKQEEVIGQLTYPEHCHNWESNE
ncbi:hypothetical protein KFU94_60275 [Chloroflexi bacterium TSY]|nr:hypothetical protein [Chloroflexi bacterium TSY]